MHTSEMQVMGISRLELGWSGERLRALLPWAPQVRFLLSQTGYNWKPGFLDPRILLSPPASCE